jgi:hypothetical protein
MDSQNNDRLRIETLPEKVACFWRAFHKAQKFFACKNFRSFYGELNVDAGSKYHVDGEYYVT